MARWQANSQAGRAALLKPDELALYGGIYSYMANVNAAMADEQMDWAKLRSLEHLRQLTPEMGFELTSTLQQARYINWRLSLWSVQIEALADRLDLRPRAQRHDRYAFGLRANEHPARAGDQAKQPGAKRTVRTANGSFSIPVTETPA